MASVRQVSRQFGLAASTVRGIDLRDPKRWDASRRKLALCHMGVDEIYPGKKEKFLTVACNLESSETLWLKSERKKAWTVFSNAQLPAEGEIGAACVDMCESFRLS